MLSVQKHGWGAAVFAAQVLDAVMDCASYTGTLALVDMCGFDNHHWFSRRFIFAPHSSWGGFQTNFDISYATHNQLACL